MHQLQREGTMYGVYIRFIDGATLRFRAREFNTNAV
jgi:hypothetical protein